MDPVIPFVIILTIQGHQFIGAENFPTEEQCTIFANQTVTNTTIKAECIPNVAGIPEGAVEQ